MRWLTPLFLARHGQRYKIYETSALSDREPQGILMVRLRMELKPEKDRIMSYFAFPPPEFYVNVKDGKDFDLVYVSSRVGTRCCYPTTL
jgi:hypothetical protein